MPSDPNPLEEKLDKWAKAFVTPHVGLALLVAILWLIPLVSVIAFLGCLFIQVRCLQRRRFATVALSLMAMPFTIWFTLGCYTYFAGTAIVHGGSPYVGLISLDPELRCDRVANGCLVYGNEWMTRDANDFAVRFLTGIFGPEPGAYRGAYPSRKEVFDALKNAAPAAQISGDQIIGQGNTYKLDPRTAEVLNDNPPTDTAPDPQPIKAVLFKNQCLIVELRFIILIDVSTGRQFAWYEPNRQLGS